MLPVVHEEGESAVKEFVERETCEMNGIDSRFLEPVAVEHLNVLETISRVHDEKMKIVQIGCANSLG